MNAPAIPAEAVRNFLHGAETLDMAFEIEQGKPTYRYCLHHARIHNSNRETSEDIATRAMAKAYGARSTFRGEFHPAKFCGWLRQIVRNEARDHYRREFRRMDRFEFSPTLIHFVIDNSPRLEERIALRGLLYVCDQEVVGPIEQSCLSDLERRVIYLTGWREMDGQKAAAELELTPKQYENALLRARTKLRTKLETTGWLAAGERIIKDRLEYGFAPDSGQRYTKPFRHLEDSADHSDRYTEEN